jgi:hypothetical protein
VLRTLKKCPGPHVSKGGTHNPIYVSTTCGPGPPRGHPEVGWRKRVVELNQTTLQNGTDQMSEEEENEMDAKVEAYNERVRAAGLTEEFDKAIESQDADDLIAVWKKLGHSDGDIEKVLAILPWFRPKGFDPDGFVPRDKFDHASANRAIAAGYPAVEPVLWHLLEWLQDTNWPVAQDLAPFLASIGKPLIPHIKKTFETDDHCWKSRIIQEIFLESPEVAAEFRDELRRIAHSPTESEITEELPEEALNVLNHYGWNR